ncbi:hypothetical protein HCJ76_44200 [Streptomyces sp. MC1]|uniref:hypothetical protein n=1 Tax=Streptomyces sp. MC1 TaxID=295105 RepID=UPI0018CB3B47|nr:hypothetical protein [Streptomyces sp. MC1]MBG7704887.1 hypothetical protein [Streptomyces sp. MC1]
MNTTPGTSAAQDGDSLSWPHLPQKAAEAALGVTHRSRFVVATSATAPMQARNVARSILALILAPTETSQAVSRQVQACIAELTGIAYTRAMNSSHLVCELWQDTEHVFFAVQHQEPLPLLPDETTIGLNVVKALAHDYGSHLVDGQFQMWAAIRIP